MKIKNKMIGLVLIFLLLFPFRLPISVLLIELFNNIATLGGSSIPMDVLRSNVMMTKIIYNIAISSLSLYNIEVLSRELKGRKPLDSYNDESLYWWTVLVMIALIIYQGFDGYWTYELFNHMSLNI